MDLRQIKQYFTPRTILDIGANVGQFHKLAKQEFPDSFVFSIEASEECEEELSKVTKDYYIGLLTKDSEEYDFYTRKGDEKSTGSSIYKELTPFFSDESLKVVKKKGVRLDDLFTSDTYFDLIKIDTQGSELDIISGGLDLCRKSSGILLEVSLVPYNENSPLYEDVLDFMQKINYIPICEIGYGHHPITRELIQKDILFLKSI